MNIKQFKPIKEKENYSGRLLLRMTPETHERVSDVAHDKQMSINLLINMAIEEYLRNE